MRVTRPRFLKQFHDLVVAAAARMLKRRYAIIVGQIDVCAGTDQQFDDPNMRRTPVTEDDRLQQGRPAEPVDVIDIDPCLDQGINRFDMAALGRGNERRAAIAIDAFEIRAMGKRELENVEMAAGAGIEIGAVLNLVLGIDIGAGLDQRPRGLHLVAMRRDKQCRRTACVPRLDGSAVDEQFPDGGDVARCGRLV